jgi:hypothetical protein
MLAIQEYNFEFGKSFTAEVRPLHVEDQKPNHFPLKVHWTEEQGELIVLSNTELSEAFCLH